jgi:putative transposase
MKVMPDHCHLFLNCLPTDSPSGIMAKVKGVTSRILRQEFPHLAHCLVYGHVVYGHVPSLSAPQKMYPVKPLNDRWKNQKQGGETVQTLTIQIRFFPDSPKLLRQLSREYIHTVNALTERAEKEGSFPKVTTKDVDAHLPSAVLNQAIRDAKSVSKKMKKTGKRPILKKPVYFVNNQNYTIGEQMIAFPIMLDGKTRKTRFRAMVTERDKNLIQRAKLGLMRIVEKRGKWYAQISLSIPVTEKKNEKVMGVDLGLKVPAVAVTSNGKTRFFGNGRQNKYIRRKYQQRRRKLGKLKKLSAIRKMNNKEQRIMKDINHKISR